VLARVLLLTAVTFWGWTFVATKICLAYLNPLELFGARLTLALPAIYLLLRLRGVSLRRPKRLGSVLLGSALISAHFLIQISGLQSTSATNTGWIIAITPLVMALLARVLLGERLSRAVVVGIAVATLGIVLLVSRGRLGDLDWLRSVGDWLVLLSTMTWALFSLATRDLSRDHDPLLITFWVLLPPTALALGFLAWSLDWPRLAGMPIEAQGALLFLGIPGMALAQWFWQVGLARLGASRAGLFLYLEPLATMVLAVPYLGERLGVATVLGGLLVLTGVGCAQRRG
jgi:drug/metabolite transporter (DMT)-like permease